MKDIRRIWLIRLKNGELIRSRKDLNADHKQAKSKGGPTTNDNLQPTHKWCNEARGNVDLEDWNVYSYVYLKTLVER